MSFFNSVDSNVDFCFNSDEGSVAELEWNTWDEACALEFQHASVVFPPDSAVVHPAVNIKDNICDMGDSGHPAWDVCCTGRAFDTHGYVGCVDGNIYMARLCLLGRHGMVSMMQRKEEYVDIWGWSHGLMVIWDPGIAESRPLAVCYDCLCLISLFRTVMSLSYDWDELEQILLLYSLFIYYLKYGIQYHLLVEMQILLRFLRGICQHI